MYDIFTLFICINLTTMNGYDPVLSFNINYCFVKCSPHRFLRHVFEMPSRCVRDDEASFDLFLW